jgi:hypothetical protein
LMPRYLSEFTGGRVFAKIDRMCTVGFLYLVFVGHV